MKQYLTSFFILQRPEEGHNFAPLSVNKLRVSYTALKV
jgi:hypothetical protein